MGTPEKSSYWCSLIALCIHSAIFSVLFPSPLSALLSVLVFLLSLDNCKFLAVSPPLLSICLGDLGQVTASQSFGLCIC